MKFSSTTKTIQKLGHIHSRKIFSFLKITQGSIPILYVSRVFHSYLREIVRKKAAVTSKKCRFSKGTINMSG